MNGVIRLVAATVLSVVAVGIALCLGWVARCYWVAWFPKTIDAKHAGGDLAPLQQARRDSDDAESELFI